VNPDITVTAKYFQHAQEYIIVLKTRYVDTCDNSFQIIGQLMQPKHASGFNLYKFLTSEMKQDDPHWAVFFIPQKEKKGVYPQLAEFC